MLEPPRPLPMRVHCRTLALGPCVVAVSASRSAAERRLFLWRRMISPGGEGRAVLVAPVLVPQGPCWTLDASWGSVAAARLCSCRSCFNWEPCAAVLTGIFNMAKCVSRAACSHGGVGAPFVSLLQTVESLETPPTAP